MQVVTTSFAFNGQSKISINWPMLYVLNFPFRRNYHSRIETRSLKCDLEKSFIYFIIFNWAIAGLFFFIFVYSKQLIEIKICQWLDLNHRSLVSPVTALPTEPQPLTEKLFLQIARRKTKYFTHVWIDQVYG